MTQFCKQLRKQVGMLVARMSKQYSQSRVTFGRKLVIAACVGLFSCKSTNLSNAARFIEPDQYCGYTDGDIPKRLELLNGNDFRPKTLVSRITGFSGLNDKFQVRYSNVNNAAASIVGDQRYILINPKYMEYVRNEAGTDWAVAIVLAHEIGHHLSGHTLNNEGSRPEKELEADHYSGYVLNLMGANLRETLAWRAGLRDPQVVTTHPKRADRLKAIENGWRRAKQNKEPSLKGLSHATVLTPEEKIAHENRIAEERERTALEEARIRDEEEKKALYEMLTPIAEFRDVVWRTQASEAETTNLVVQFTLDVRNAQSDHGHVALLFENDERKLIRDMNGLWTSKDGYASAITRYLTKPRNARFPHQTIMFPLNEIEVPLGKHIIYPILRFYEQRDNGVILRVKQFRLSPLRITRTNQ